MVESFHPSVRKLISTHLWWLREGGDEKTITGGAQIATGRKPARHGNAQVVLSIRHFWRAWKQWHRACYLRNAARQRGPWCRALARPPAYSAAA